MMLNINHFAPHLDHWKIFNGENFSLILIFLFTLILIRITFPEKLSKEEILVRQKMAEEYLNSHREEDEEFFLSD